MDSLPPPPPAVAAPAPAELTPRNAREKELCDRASHVDWLYLAGLVALDAGAIYADSLQGLQTSDSVPARFIGPTAVGLTWGATIGGGWLALPKCDPEFVREAPREGEVHAEWPLALSLALLAGATAPIVNGIVVGSNQPLQWSTLERSMHLVAAGIAGFGGALLPYLLPPRTWSAASDLRALRVTASDRGVSVGYSVSF